jgi:hypothetical protein
MGPGRSAADAEASNPDADPALAAAGSRKRRIASGPFPAAADGPAGGKPAKQAAGGRAHAALSLGSSPCASAAHRSQSGEPTPTRPAAAPAAAAVQDKRWSPGMYMDPDGLPRVDPHAARARDPHAPDGLRHGRWADALATCPLSEVSARPALIAHPFSVRGAQRAACGAEADGRGRGQLLTARANAVAMAGSGCEVAVRVVADVPQHASPHDGEWGARMQRGAAAAGGGQMRGKAVLAFQRAEGADALILGLYVHEYGPGAAPAYAGRIMVECIDSPPVWPAPPGVCAANERQVRPPSGAGASAPAEWRDCLDGRMRRVPPAVRMARGASGGGSWRAVGQAIVTAMLHGYMEAAAKRGFKSIHMHVPPPQVPHPASLHRRRQAHLPHLTAHE